MWNKYFLGRIHCSICMILYILCYVAIGDTAEPHSIYQYIKDILNNSNGFVNII